MSRDRQQALDDLAATVRRSRGAFFYGDNRLADFTVDEALITAAEFLRGAYIDAGFQGYMDPEAGECSTVFALVWLEEAIARLKDAE